MFNQHFRQYFAEGLKNLDCLLISAGCLGSLEQQVKETFDSAKKSSESQTKGELALQEVHKVISFIDQKWDAYEQERKENLYWNRTMIHGIAENRNENTDQHAIDFINDNLDIKIDEKDIDRSHRIGRYDKVKEKARAIIVKIARYNVRGKVFWEKRKLNGAGKSITESLTTKRIG